MVSSRTETRFAFFPVKLTDGTIVWFTRYQVDQTRTTIMKYDTKLQAWYAGDEWNDGKKHKHKPK